MKFFYGLALLLPLTVFASEQNILTDFVDLRKSSDLKPLIRQEYQFGKPYQDLQEIIERTSECEPRFIKAINNSNYGLAFSINPEVLKYLFLHSTDKTILEIAGGGGENCQILSYGPATHIYYNDISKQEIIDFQNHTHRLDPTISSRLTTLPGNILQMRSEHPELKGKIDIFYCRNLIHFLKDQDLKEFFDTIKFLAKEDATLVISANCVYGTPDLKQVLRNHPDTTQFNQKQILMYQNGVSMPIAKLGAICEPTRGNNIDPLVFDKYEIATNFLNMAQINQEGLQKMGDQLANIFISALDDSNLPECLMGYFTVHETNVRCFTAKTLSKLVEDHGFECKNSFFIDKLGHVMNVTDAKVSDDQYEGVLPNFVGAIVQLKK